MQHGQLAIELYRGTSKNATKLCFSQIPMRSPISFKDAISEGCCGNIQPHQNECKLC